jgi:hypothetical protein
MRNKIIILFFIFISSCQNLPIFEKVQNYEKVGFAEISNGDQIIHHTIVPTSQIRITNLLNNKNIIVNIDKNLNYKRQREIIIPYKYSNLLELNSNLPLVKIETLRVNKNYKANIGQIYEEEKKIVQNIDVKNVEIVDLSKNKKSADIKLKKIEIIYGDFIYKNSALDMVSLLKKEISNVNPVIAQVNKKYRVKAKIINDINDFDIFFDKIVNTKFENYNLSVD